MRAPENKRRKKNAKGKKDEIRGRAAAEYSRQAACSRGAEKYKGAKGGAHQGRRRWPVQHAADVVGLERALESDRG